jgi:hypothetical protein
LNGQYKLLVPFEIVINVDAKDVAGSLTRPIWLSYWWEYVSDIYCRNLER